jgi:hypothetical protein
MSALVLRPELSCRPDPPAVTASGSVRHGQDGRMRGNLEGMRRCWLSGALWLGFSAACTQPNPAFELATGASSGDTEERDSSADGDDSGKAGASVGGTGERDGTSGRDTERGDDSGGTTDEGEGSDDTGDRPEGAPCSIAECGPNLYCWFPEGSVCGYEHDVMGVCKERPLQCPPDLDPVLACDCQTWFDNPCRARQAGFDVACRDGDDECVC